MEISKSDFQEKLCQMMRSLRIRAGLKQSDMAERMGLSSSQYVYYEIGKAGPDLFTLRKMAEIFEIDASTLLYPEKFAPPADSAQTKSS